MSQSFFFFFCTQMPDDGICKFPFVCVFGWFTSLTSVNYKKKKNYAQIFTTRVETLYRSFSYVQWICYTLSLKSEWVNGSSVWACLDTVGDLFFSRWFIMYNVHTFASLNIIYFSFWCDCRMLWSARHVYLFFFYFVFSFDEIYKKKIKSLVSSTWTWMNWWKTENSIFEYTKKWHQIHFNQKLISKRYGWRRSKSKCRIKIPINRFYRSQHVVHVSSSFFINLFEISSEFKLQLGVSCGFFSCIIHGLDFFFFWFNVCVLSFSFPFFKRIQAKQKKNIQRKEKKKKTKKTLKTKMAKLKNPNMYLNVWCVRKTDYIAIGGCRCYRSSTLDVYNVMYERWMHCECFLMQIDFG